MGHGIADPIVCTSPRKFLQAFSLSWPSSRCNPLLCTLLQAKENKAKANPDLAAANKASADAKRERRKASGSTKEFK